MSVGLICRDIEHNESSPFYSYLLKDVYFSGLKYYAHGFDKRNIDKFNLADHISLTSVPLSKNNDVFQGLPIPPKLKKSVSLLNEKHPHWILAYHDIDELALFVLFPSEPNTESEDLVKADRDLDRLKYQETKLKTHPHSFVVDRLYIWPHKIFIKLDHKLRKTEKVGEALVFDVPQIFLSREEVLIPDYKQVSYKLDRYSAKEILEIMADVDLAKNKYFNVFYDDNGFIIYLRSNLYFRKNHRFPDVFFEPKGCKWKNKEKFDMKSKNLNEAGRRLSISEWLNDS